MADAKDTPIIINDENWKLVQQLSEKYSKSVSAVLAVFIGAACDAYRASPDDMDNYMLENWTAPEAG